MSALVVQRWGYHVRTTYKMVHSRTAGLSFRNFFWGDFLVALVLRKRISERDGIMQAPTFHPPLLSLDTLQGFFSILEKKKKIQPALLTEMLAAIPGHLHQSTYLFSSASVTIATLIHDNAYVVSVEIKNS